MKKLPCLFVRDFSNPKKPVTLPIVNGDCEWVANGEGTATRKYDGSCCKIEDRTLFARYDAKHGKKPPANFVPAQGEPDPITGHWPGWVPVGDEPQFKYHREAWEFVKLVDFVHFEDGTYELCGPKIQGNPEKFNSHVLIPHGKYVFLNCPRDFEGIKEFLRNLEVEGIVFHHPDGRMCKIRKKDFDYS